MSRNNPFGGPRGLTGKVQKSTNAGIRLNAIVTETHYTVEAELPGCKLADVRLTINAGEVTIEVVKRRPETEAGGTLLFNERVMGELSRTIRLPGASATAVSQTLDNGVLTLTIARRVKSDEPELS